MSGRLFGFDVADLLSVLAGVGGLVAAWRSIRQAKVEAQVTATGLWATLNEGQSKELARLRERMADVEGVAEARRRRVDELEDRVDELERQLEQEKRECFGRIGELERQLAALQGGK